jgi:16S rRNA G966 N2-methylase RsmD
LTVLRKNLASLGIASGVYLHAGSVGQVLRQMRTDAAFDLVFLDPPYDAADAYEVTLGLLGGGLAVLLAPGALVIAEHRKKEKLEEHYGALERTRLLEQGDAGLSFYAAAPAGLTPVEAF